MEDCRTTQRRLRNTAINMTKWEIVAISSGKREQVCDTLEHARTLCTLMQIEGRDRYKIQEVTHYETHEQEIHGRKT